MSRTILSNVDGFTPVIDSVVRDTSLTTAVVFGRVWRFCQMKNGVCQASLEKIAEGIGISIPTLMVHIKRLEEGKYLEDTTPNLRNRPHTYRDTGKAGLYMAVSGTKEFNTSDDLGTKELAPATKESDLGTKNLSCQDKDLIHEDSNKKELKKEEKIDFTKAQKIWSEIDKYLRSETSHQFHKYYDTCVPVVWDDGRGGLLVVQAEDPQWLNQNVSKKAARYMVGITHSINPIVEFVPGAINITEWLNGRS
jgi:DNA-binding Lrp family transcriptional regulator